MAQPDANGPRVGRLEPYEAVNHPDHYGGDTVYEVIKVLEAWRLNENARLWNAVKYIARAGKKGDALEDLKKARFYLDREIQSREQTFVGETKTTTIT